MREVGRCAVGAQAEALQIALRSGLGYRVYPSLWGLGLRA